MRRSPEGRDSTDEGPDVPAVRDAFFGGALQLLQPARGYRINIDTLILAHFAAAARPRARSLVDLGAGVGALSLAYGRFARLSHATLVESDPRLIEFARKNLASAEVRGEVHRLELGRDRLPDALRGTADVVVSNPPFFASSPGRAASARSRARSGSAEPFLAAAAVLMGRRAHAFFVYPTEALVSLLAAAENVGLVAKRLRLVHPFAAAPARIALLEFRRAKPGGLVIEPPLVEWASRGVRSAELEAITRGDRSVGPVG